MHGSNNLTELIRNMQPVLLPEPYVFCSVPHSQLIDYSMVLGSFREQEGITLIVEKRIADEHGLQYNLIASCITLMVHSALEAVGLTAAFSKALADGGISCNVVAGYYHDHIFVREQDAIVAIKLLKQLSEQQGA